MLFYVLAVITMTVGNVAALTQSNLKRMLAYSSIAHVGYVLIGVVVGTARGVEAMLVYLAVYVFMQLGAFTIIALMRRQDVIGDELKDLSGLYLRSPVAAFAMLFFMLSLGGIPPTAGFIGKVFLFGAAIEAGYIWLAVIAVVNSALSIYYYVRVVVFMWIKEDIIGSPVVVSPATAVALTIAVLGTVALGLYPRFLIDFAHISAQTLGVADAIALGRRRRRDGGLAGQAREDSIWFNASSIKASLSSFERFFLINLDATSSDRSTTSCRTCTKAFAVSN